MFWEALIIACTGLCTPSTLEFKLKPVENRAHVVLAHEASLISSISRLDTLSKQPVISLIVDVPSSGNITRNIFRNKKVLAKKSNEYSKYFVRKFIEQGLFPFSEGVYLGQGEQEQKVALLPYYLFLSDISKLFLQRAPPLEEEIITSNMIKLAMLTDTRPRPHNIVSASRALLYNSASAKFNFIIYPFDLEGSPSMALLSTVFLLNNATSSLFGVVADANHVKNKYGALLRIMATVIETALLRSDSVSFRDNEGRASMPNKHGHGEVVVVMPISAGRLPSIFCA